MIHKGDEVFDLLKATVPSGIAQFPPNVAKLLELELLSYDDQEHIMHVRMPIKPDFNNPFHITFGGTYGMYFDMAFGPFSGLVTMMPTTSLDLNITYIKPLSVADQYCHIKAYVTSQSKQFLNLRGEALKEDGTLVATATSRMMIIDPTRLKR
jgi:acyl-coenzyme A thioesterase PaaI-like protein